MHSAEVSTKEVIGSTLLAIPRKGITEKMCEVLVWLAEGKSYEEIGIIIGISARAVKARARSIMDHLDAVNRAQLVAKAFVIGVLHGLPALLLAIILYGPDGTSQIDKMRNARRVTGRRSREEHCELIAEVYDHSTHPTPTLEYV